jgi:hypothetical protein
MLSHVDADHVEGLVRLFAEKPLPVAVKRVWFNGWRQMSGPDHTLGPLQGEFLSALLVDRVPGAWKPDAPPWCVPPDGKLPVMKLPGDMSLTLLSPNPTKLKAMASEWRTKLEGTGIRPGQLEQAWKLLGSKTKFLPRQGLLGAAPSLDRLLKRQFKIDPAKANGSSIAVLAEYAGKSALLLADAHPDVIADSLGRLCTARGVKRLAVDAVKVSHHGSRANTNEALLKLIASPRYLISTNGAQFRHPDRECLARIIKLGKPRTLYFNYASRFTNPWIKSAADHGYEAIVRSKSDLALRVVL